MQFETPSTFFKITDKLIESILKRNGKGYVRWMNLDI